jgi:hypothetical protein
MRITATAPLIAHKKEEKNSAASNSRVIVKWRDNLQWEMMLASHHRV